jgi:hypothetical protein
MGRTGWVLLAAVLLLVGAGSLFIEGISYATRETVVEVGPLEVTTEREERIGLPLWVSVVMVLAGTGALFVGAGRSQGS